MNLQYVMFLYPRCFCLILPDCALIGYYFFVIIGLYLLLVKWSTSLESIKKAKDFWQILLNHNAA